MIRVSPLVTGLIDGFSRNITPLQATIRMTMVQISEVGATLAPLNIEL